MELYKDIGTNDLQNEEWRDVVGYEGLYKVSNMGRIKSLNTSQIMKQWLCKGYLMVSLRNKGNKSNHLVHRVVAENFIPKIESKKFVNHKDENKLNNAAYNLEWVTTIENNNYGTRNERIAKNQMNRNDCSKPILQFTLNGEFVKEWDSIGEACRCGFNRKGISCVCRGVPNYNTSGGYIWKFK